LRIAIAVLLGVFTLCSALADEDAVNKYIMNFDLMTKTADGEDGYRINLRGIHLPDGKVLHGDDLAEFNYFLTVSGTDYRGGKLAIELYEYESRAKTSDIVSEIVVEADFVFGEPGRIQSRNDRFGIDLAFSISRL